MQVSLDILSRQMNKLNFSGLLFLGSLLYYFVWNTDLILEITIVIIDNGNALWSTMLCQTLAKGLNEISNVTLKHPYRGIKCTTRQ